MISTGKRLRDLRESMKLSQVKIAEMVGLKQTSINRYENDKSEAPYRVLLWYADYFDVSLDYIFGRCEEPQGKLYEFKPKIENEEFKQFIEMCFDPSSPISDRLKQSMIQMYEERKNTNEKQWCYVWLYLY